MEQKILKTHILLRRSPLQEQEDVNPILSAGETGITLDIGKCKIGDGRTLWAVFNFLIEKEVDNVIKI